MTIKTVGPFAAAIAQALCDSGMIDLSHDDTATEVLFAQRATVALGKLMPEIAAALTHHAADMATDEAAFMASVMSARIETVAGTLTFETWRAARYAVPCLAAAPALALYYEHGHTSDVPDLGGFIYPAGSLSDAAMHVCRTVTGYAFDAGGCVLSAHTLEAIERLLWVNWAADCVGDQLSPAALDNLTNAPHVRGINDAPLYRLV